MAKGMVCERCFMACSISLMQWHVLHNRKYAMVGHHLFLDRLFCFGILRLRRFILRQRVVGWISIWDAAAVRFQLFFLKTS